MPTKTDKSKKVVAKKTGKGQAPASMVASQEAKIKKRGGRVSFRRDGNLPVGNY